MRKTWLAALFALCAPLAAQEGAQLRMDLDHLEENVRVATMSGPLADDVYAEAKRRLDGVGETSEG